MGLYTLPGGVGNVKAASTADGGTALTTSAATVLLPRKTRHINLIPRNFSTAVVAKWTKIPYLTVLKTSDLLAAIANTTDYSSEAQDGSTSTDVTLSSLGTFAQSDALYIGAFEPFIGVVVDIDGANGNASVLTVKYRKSDNTWATTSATDGTDDTGKTFGVDGSVTWTEPTDWIAHELASSESPDPRFGAIMRRQMFWTRWEVSAALDSAVTLNSMVAIPRAAYSEIPSGFAWAEAVKQGFEGIAGISALTDAGTCNFIVDVAAPAGGRY